MHRREFLIGALALATFPTSGFAFPDALIVNRTETCGCCGAPQQPQVSVRLTIRASGNAKPLVGKVASASAPIKNSRRCILSPYLVVVDR